MTGNNLIKEKQKLAQRWAIGNPLLACGPAVYAWECERGEEGERESERDGERKSEKGEDYQ